MNDVQCPCGCNSRPLISKWRSSERSVEYMITIRYRNKENIERCSNKPSGIKLETARLFVVGSFMLVSEEGLYKERTFHGSQPTAQPLSRGNGIALLPRLGGRGEDGVVGVGEGPDSGIGSSGGGNGAKLVAWGGKLSRSAPPEEKSDLRMITCVK